MLPNSIKKQHQLREVKRSSRLSLNCVSLLFTLWWPSECSCIRDDRINWIPYWQIIRWLKFQKFYCGRLISDTIQFRTICWSLAYVTWVTPAKHKLERSQFWKPRPHEKMTTLGTRIKVSDSLLFLDSWGALFRPSKIAKPAVFQAVLRGIGKSFQSAITAPRINLTGYGNATAQSWLSNTGKHFCSKTSFSSMWDVINISQAH